MRDTQRLIAVWGVFVIFVICMIGVGAAVQNSSFVNDGARLISNFVVVLIAFI
jgi:hypothetical protein